MESNVLKAVEEISGYTPDEMIAMYNDYGRMAKEWEAYASAGLSPEVCAEYRKFEDEVVVSGMTFGEVVELMHASQRREKADAELIRKIYFATDEDLCDCCRKIVRMIEAWWNDDEKGEAE